jgi:hypothetical protein
MDIQLLFEAELRRRGHHFSIDSQTGLHIVEIDSGRRLFVCLSNLKREIARDGDLGRIARFTESVLGSTDAAILDLSPDQLYWSLETSDYKDRADYRVSISERVDRVLVHITTTPPLITWVTPEMLASLNLTEEEAGSKAFSNLGKALGESSVGFIDIDGVNLGYITTSFPSKASLILAQNLEEIVRDKLGWPLLAVAPDRDFLYLLAAQHLDFVQRLGTVVLDQYAEAAYAISTEVFEISDQGIHVIGDFRRNENG